MRLAEVIKMFNPDPVLAELKFFKEELDKIKAAVQGIEHLESQVNDLIIKIDDRIKMREDEIKKDAPPRKGKV
jgi:cell division GTPase FtsZ